MNRNVTITFDAICISNGTLLEVHICQIFPKSTGDCVFHSYISSNVKKLELFLKNSSFSVGNIYVVEISTENDKVYASSGLNAINKKGCENGKCSEIALLTQ